MREAASKHLSAARPVWIRLLPAVRVDEVSYAIMEKGNCQQCMEHNCGAWSMERMKRGHNVK